MEQANGALVIPKFEEVPESEQKVGGNKGLKPPQVRRSDAINFDNGESKVDIDKIVKDIPNESH